jgi:hypothetical protein
VSDEKWGSKLYTRAALKEFYRTGPMPDEERTASREDVQS